MEAIQKAKGDIVKLEEAKKKNKVTALSHKKSRIHRLRQEIRRARRVIKAFRDNEDLQKDQYYTKLYNDTAQRVEERSKELEKLLKEGLLTIGPDNDISYEKCTLAKWMLFNDQFKVCTTHRMKDLCLKMLERSNFSCWNLFKSMDWVKKKKYVEYLKHHKKIFYGVKRDVLEHIKRVKVKIIKKVVPDKKKVKISNG
jgi:hypothetical protein